ncbi:aminomethyl-transferring glycine dehydrogenase subunit GcvPA [Vagococcus elongatus]|uniref:Probable glycine dehydrogenase (decarboxylating) subunit 1 n=1 Tax=Vagococcus elongatus TaxID=180344 RepID=A0A430AX71_9ENTE|nr:aminomethyl-transferring glycine dehydrogenase subunit GcvPA [Vagococcus elongatus]RSU12649.1 glycine dehydrogenase (aminomethyl-transferring) [Vagococcus elongatus]
MGRYSPITTSDQELMLAKLGLSSIDDLYKQVSKDLLIDGLDIPSGKSEMEVRQIMTDLAAKNKVYRSIFRGAGAYNHYIPALVKQIVSKEEFLTTYTPYQAEISQGVLQSIFEYQTMICQLTGMEIANASIYDGATAAAEAVNMTMTRKQNKILISETVHPMTIETIQTYANSVNNEVIIVPQKDGVTDVEKLAAMLEDDVACFVLQQPNYFGQIEEAEKIGALLKENKQKFIMSINPVAGVKLKTPFECQADIATGEGQPLGLDLAFGGPYLGFLAASKEFLHKIPGRIVGETEDTEGKRGYVLTLQAREQHIRRERASSNICSNQAHCALTASVYMTVMGPEGLKDVARQCYSKTHYLADALTQIPTIELKYPGEFFHEFVTTSTKPAIDILEKLDEENILGGYPLNETDILWCATEMNSKEDIDRLASIVKEVM